MSTIAEFEKDVRELLAAGFKGLKNAVEANEGVLDEKSCRSLEILNKCVTEIMKRMPKEGDSSLAMLSDEELSRDF